VKAWSVQGRTGKRLVAGVLAGGTAIALLGGCGFGTRQQAAAVVNGQEISQAEVEQTAKQLKDAKLDFDEKIVVTVLIAAPLLHEVVDASGSWKPDSVYAGVINAMPDATESTKQFVRAVALLQSAAMTDQDVAAYRKDLKDAKITVNPRFGSLEPSNSGPVYFTLGDEAPNWIKSTPVAQ
jgi:hypothetical protein